MRTPTDATGECGAIFKLSRLPNMPSTNRNATETIEDTRYTIIQIRRNFKEF